MEKLFQISMISPLPSGRKSVGLGNLKQGDSDDRLEENPAHLPIGSGKTPAHSNLPCSLIFDVSGK